MRPIFYLLVILALVLWYSAAYAQDSTTLILVPDADNLTLYVAGTGVVSLSGLEFVVDIDGIPSLHSLDFYPNFKSLDLDHLQAPVCLQLWRSGGITPPPLACASITYIQGLGGIDVFWYDDFSHSTRTIQVLRDNSQIAICGAEQRSCDIPYPAPTATPTVTPTATDTPTITPTESPTITPSVTPTPTITPDLMATQIAWLNEQMTATALHMSTSPPESVTPCYIYANEYTGVRVYVGPGFNRFVRALLTGSARVIGETEDRDGNRWWQIQPPNTVPSEAEHYWVSASDPYITTSGDCPALTTTGK